MRTLIKMCGPAALLLAGVQAPAEAQFLASPYYGTKPITQGYHGGHPAYDYSISYQQVLAAGSGTVTRVAWYSNAPECHQSATNSACGYGLHIYITHANGYVSRYAHLSSTAYDLNTTTAAVNDGTVIGTSGHTGYSSGPHLHFEVKTNTGGNVDPYASGLWKDGEAKGHPLPAMADAGSITVDDNTASNSGFSKGRGGPFNNPCPPGSCPFWNLQASGNGSDSYYTLVNGSVADYWASWSPTLPTGGGNYEIFVHVPGNHATSWQAPFIVRHAGGTRVARVDQNGLFNRWVSIGVYRLVPGNFVYTHDGTGEGVGTHCGSGVSCEVAADAVRFVRRDTLHQNIWRGDQGWSRIVPVVGGVPQFGSASGWVGPSALSYLPGSGTLQTENMSLMGSSITHAVWRGDQGWSRTIPVVNGEVRWASASGWSGPIGIGGLPGSGSMETQNDFVTGTTLTQAFWRGSQGWTRTVPIVGGVPQWGSASAWGGPISITGLPGSGTIQTQSASISATSLNQGFWRGNQGWARTVPIIGGVPQWGSASAWNGPINIAGLPGSGTLQTQADVQIP